MKPIHSDIQLLGDRIQSRWHQHSFDNDYLPAIAMEELNRDRLHERITLEDLTALMLQENPQAVLPMNELFGDAALTLYKAPRFFIEALLWTEGTTSIHQHQFSGAFSVLWGGSFHAQYRFELQKRINASMGFGELKMESSELLQRGDVRGIEAGSKFIHALFHLETPSITLVVRTFSNHDSGPQYRYSPPGIARDPFFHDPVLIHQLRYLKMLLTLDRPLVFFALRDFFIKSDLHTAYVTMEKLRDLLLAKDLWKQALDWIREVHGEYIQLLEGAFEEAHRSHYIATRRRLIKDADIRFFLAMLLNAPSLECIRDITRMRLMNHDVDKQLVTWIAQVLDAHRIQYEDGDLDIIRYALESPSDEHIIKRLQEKYCVAEVDQQISLIRSISDELRRNPMFRPLFRR
jgi:hypothetical protein